MGNWFISGSDTNFNLQLLRYWLIDSTHKRERERTQLRQRMPMFLVGKRSLSCWGLTIVLMPRLSFYLYCSQLITSIPEEPQALGGSLVDGDPDQHLNHYEITETVLHHTGEIGPRGDTHELLSTSPRHPLHRSSLAPSFGTTLDTTCICLAAWPIGLLNAH